MPPFIEMAGVSRSYAAPTPLRIQHLAVSAADRLVIHGLDQGAAEMFVLLVTGAALPDEGLVRVDQCDTREIATDAAWLASLDRFGLVTHRAVLIDQLPIASNLALPLTLSIDPMPDEMLTRVGQLAQEAGLAVGRLAAAAATLSPDERLRVHLARALAPDPALLLLEHPTAPLTSAHARAAFGETLREVAERRGIGWIALSDDPLFAAQSRGVRQRLDTATGRLQADGWWQRLLGRSHP
jgi:putative ABC transport system ATP-binding protein